jgi:uncharacterized protein (DUF1800 family)
VGRHSSGGNRDGFTEPASTPPADDHPVTDNPFHGMPGVNLYGYAPSVVPLREAVSAATLLEEPTSAKTVGGFDRRKLLGLLGIGAAAAACGTAVKVVDPQFGTPGGGTTPRPFPAVASGKASTVATGGSKMAAGAAGGVSGSVKKAAGSSNVDYQSPATGKAPKVTSASTSLKQQPTILPLDQDLHLLRRATWGITSESRADITKLGASKWLTQQFNPASLNDGEADGLLGSFDTLGKSGPELIAMNKDREKENYFYASQQVAGAAIVRAIWSKRQLFETTVDFFHSRVHVPSHFDKTRNWLNHYDVNVVRKYAFGKYSDMLWAAVTHPAMILYLDNQINTKNGGNQNLGRELLELHTLGVDAGYKQTDVQAAAIILTGIGYDDDKHDFAYKSADHATGAVNVFGWKNANASTSDGMATAKSMVTYLAKHPKTAEYLAEDLCRRYVSDAPPGSLVKRMAAAYIANDTEIIPVLKVLFTSPEFKVMVGQKYRRPMENVVAAARVLGTQSAKNPVDFKAAIDTTWYYMEQMGQTPMGKNSPDGYVDFARPWLSTAGTLGRWNSQMSLVSAWHQGFVARTPMELAGGTPPKTYGELIDRYAERLLNQKLTTNQKAALLTFAGKSSGTAITADDWKFDYNIKVRLPALILGSPNHQLR